MSKAWARSHVEKYLYFAMQRRQANKRARTGRDLAQLALKMTFDEFLQEIGGQAPTHCPVLGIELFISDDPRSSNLPTVDRIDASRPYERGNVAIISRRANVLKNDGFAEEHRRIADWMDALAARGKDVRPTSAA